MNLKIREFKIVIENYINSNDLPPEVKRMVLREIYQSAEVAANAAISEELEAREKTKRESKTDE